MSNAIRARSNRTIDNKKNKVVHLLIIPLKRINNKNIHGFMKISNLFLNPCAQEINF